MQTEDWELKTPPTLKLLRTLWELKTGYGVRVAGIELRAWSAGVSLAAEGMLYPARYEVRGTRCGVRGTGKEVSSSMYISRSLKFCSDRHCRLPTVDCGLLAGLS
jgi:hypothetical protein